MSNDPWYNSGIPAPGSVQAPSWSNQWTPSASSAQPPRAPFGTSISGPSVSNITGPQPYPSNVNVWSPATVHEPRIDGDGVEIIDPPLLDELGIDVPKIWMRMQGIALFKKLDEGLITDVDMSGPLLIVMALGILLVLRGKLYLGFIYGFGVIGFVGLYGLINLMSQKNAIDLYSTISILGYGLLPVVLLAAVAVVLSLTNTFGFILSIICVIWCTATTSRFFETAVHMEEQRWLIAYPISLVYACFVLITVF